MVTGPAVIRFAAQLVEQNEAKSGRRVMLRIPPGAGRKLAGMAQVEGTINGQSFRAVVQSDTAGELWLPVNAAMLKGAGAQAGDTVKLAVLGPEPEPQLPPELAEAFAQAPTARKVWDSLTLLGRLDWVRWIAGAKQPATRTRRVQRTVEQLSEGKRRACCVNVYEYMLMRIQQTDR